MDTMPALSLTLFVGSGLLLLASLWNLARSRRTCRNTQALLDMLLRIEQPLSRLTLDRRLPSPPPAPPFERRAAG